MTSPSRVDAARLPKLPTSRYAFADPEGDGPDIPAYSPDQMHDYARAAVATLAEQPEPELSMSMFATREDYERAVHLAQAVAVGTNTAEADALRSDVAGWILVPREPDDYTISTIPGQTDSDARILYRRIVEIAAISSGASVVVNAWSCANECADGGVRCEQWCRNPARCVASYVVTHRPHLAGAAAAEFVSTEEPSEPDNRCVRGAGSDPFAHEDTCRPKDGETWEEWGKHQVPVDAATEAAIDAAVGLGAPQANTLSDAVYTRFTRSMDEQAGELGPLTLRQRNAVHAVMWNGIDAALAAQSEQSAAPEPAAAEGYLELMEGDIGPGIRDLRVRGHLRSYPAGTRFFAESDSGADRVRVERDALRSALTELVACKDLADQFDAMKLDVPDFATAAVLDGIHAEYMRRKPLAWKSARAALKADGEAK